MKINSLLEKPLRPSFLYIFLAILVTLFFCNSEMFAGVISVDLPSYLAL